MKTGQPTPPRNAIGCLILFALPFAAFGVAAAIWLGSTILAHLRAQGWVEVPATIVRVDLKSGDDGTNQATAEYVYVYHGQKFTSRRVGLTGGYDNVGSFQFDAYRELSEHQKSGKPFRCYVNPVRPDEAILYRRLRWEMVGFQSIFAIVFSGVGFGLLIGGVRGVSKQRTERILAADQPDSPWLWRPDWARGTIVFSSKATMWTAIVVATLWNLLAVPLWILLSDMLPAKAKSFGLLRLVVPLVGLALVWWAVRAAIRWRKYGESTFHMGSVPGVIGGQLAGVIQTSIRIRRPEHGFRLTLTCLRTVSSGDTTSQETAWEDEQIVAHDILQDRDERSAIPVLFQIPYDCQPTAKTSSGTDTNWRLQVTAKMPGVDYKAIFDVPVFKTEASDPNFVADRSAIEPYTVPADPARDLRDAGVRKVASPLRDGCRFVFPMARNLGAAVFLTLFSLVWSGSIVFMRRFEVPIFFPIVFGAFDVLILACTLYVWFYRSVVDVSSQGIEVSGGLFGLGRRHWIESPDVAKIETARGMRYGPQVYYNVIIVRTNGKRVTAGREIRGSRLTAAVIRQIEDALGR